MRPAQIDQRPNRHNPARVDLLVGHIIVALDVVEVHRLGNAWLLVIPTASSRCLILRTISVREAQGHASET